MTCSACAGRVERALKAVPGVLSASIDPVGERAALRVLAGAVTPEALADAVARAGYRAEFETAAPGGPAGEAGAPGRAAAWRARRELLLLIGAALLTLPLVVPMALMPFRIHAHLNPWVEAALATPVQIFVGARFYRGAWSAIRARAGSMDVLVALGTSAAFLYSWVLVLSHGSGAAGMLYFEASAAILTLVLLGKWLEARARRSAAAAIRALTALRPEVARVVLPDGREEERPVASLAVGDRLRVRPGERVPADGRVIEGESEIDESLLTGESLPVLKRRDDPVTGGALNGTGSLVVEVTATGADTMLARIVRLVEQA